MARLVLTTAEGQQIVELRQTNSLGRHPSNTIQLLDKIVSKEHCIVEQRAEGFVLRDLGSLNGTFVNRDRVQGERDLHHGDEIALGQTKARFEEAASPQHPAPASAAAQPQWQQPQDPAWQGQGVPSAQSPQPAQQPAYQRQQPPPSHAAQSAQDYPQQQGGYARPPGPPPQRQAGPPGPPPQRRPLPPATRTPSRGFSTAYLPAVPVGTHIDTDDEARQIGAEIAATDADFRPFNEVAANMDQLRADYERLRLSYELTRDIADESDTPTLLEKILKSIFRFIPAQRGVIFLANEAGEMQPFASHRNDGGKGAISVSTTILQKVVTDRTAVLTHDAAMDFAASKGKSMILNQIQSAIVAPMLHAGELFGVLWLDSKSLAQFQPKDLELVGAVANQAAMFIEINMLGKKMENELLTRDRLSRFLSPMVRDRVIDGQLDVVPGGARTECTVYNSDIRGFTRMSEHTPPEELVEMLNSYFEGMVQVIFEFEGTLDKYMGDGIMALWGAPVPHPDDAERAVECAYRQTEVLGAFNRERMARDKSPLGVGVGIDTGHVVAGSIGTNETLSYTVIGDVANVSARLCSKALAGQIVLSETTRNMLGSRFEVEELPPTHIRGREEAVRMFNVIRSQPLSQVPPTSAAGPSDEATDEDGPTRAAPPPAD